MSRKGPQPGSAVDIKIIGTDKKFSLDVLKKLQPFLSKIPGVKDVDSDIKPGKKEIVLLLDYDKLAKYGLTVSSVAQTVRTAYEGLIATSIQTAEMDEKLEFRVKIVYNKIRIA